jgi:hypothetical protein
VGLGIGSILTPLFNQSAWANWIDKSFYEKWYSFPLLLILAALMVLGVYSEKAVVLLPAMLVSGLSVIFLLSSLWGVLAVILLNRTNRQLRWRELCLPLLLGLNVCLLQILATSWLRFLLTQTWQGIDL